MRPGGGKVKPYSGMVSGVRDSMGSDLEEDRKKHSLSVLIRPGLKWSWNPFKMLISDACI